MLNIDIKYFGETPQLEKLGKGDWIDLRAAEDVDIEKGQFCLIPLGVAMRLPEGYEAHVLPRSSTFAKWGIIMTNSMGIIDNSYSGDNDQWMFPAYATRDVHIAKSDRICQFRIMKSQETVEFCVQKWLDEVSRGGFGSTGHN